MTSRNSALLAEKGWRWSIRVLLVIVLMCPGSVLTAEEPLTLERAVQFALECNTDLRRLENQVSLGETSVNQAATQSRPNLNLSVSPSGRLSRTFEQENIAAQRQQLENERLSLDDLEQNISFAVQQALLDYRTALKKLDAADAQRISAAEALTAMETRYDTGAATFVELSQTRAQHVDAQGTWVQALYDVTLARLGVDYYRSGDAWQFALRDLAED